MAYRVQEALFTRTGNRIFLALAACISLFVIEIGFTDPHASSAQELLPIGQIQGRSANATGLGQLVRFRAIVTGLLEDENLVGTRFYTVFVQDVPGGEDGDPLTSDGIAIFAGARRPELAIGDIALFSGTVTEFYGLTELDNQNLFFSVESRNNPLPEPAILAPPADNALAATYLERYEGMLVSIPVATVAGPSHVGCGFSVVGEEYDKARTVISSESDPVGHIVGVLHPSDVNCDDMPAVATGDKIVGLKGPLTYHFDRFKIVYQDLSNLLHNPGDPQPASKMESQDGQLVVATFNVNDYFDSNDDTKSDAEPKLTAAELSLKQAKIAATVAERLNCPDIVGLQEVENERLLEALASRLVDLCGFSYRVSHLEGPDARGIDVALLSNSARAEVTRVELRQGCTEQETGIVDPLAQCPEGLQPLFSRPPLQVDVVIGQQAYVVLVNHFKSKRDGAEETAERRLAQATFVNKLVQEILDAADGDQMVIVMGDFNDYDGSEVMQLIQGKGALVDALAFVPRELRYSYIFDGASQLIDWILLSPALAAKIVSAGVAHGNADYPFQLGQNADSHYLSYRSSDHDVPYVVLELEPLESLSDATPTVQADQDEAVLQVTVTIEKQEAVIIGDQLALTPTGAAEGTEGQADQNAGVKGLNSEAPLPERFPRSAFTILGCSVLLLLMGALVLLVIVRARRDNNGAGQGY